MLPAIARALNVSVSIVARIRSVVARYAAKKKLATSASMLPNRLPRAAPAPKLADMIARQPVSASDRPIQNDARGRLWKMSHEIIPTKNGVLLPRIEATAACVIITDVFQSPRSSAKNTPPPIASHIVRADTDRRGPRARAHGINTRPAISTR